MIGSIIDGRYHVLRLIGAGAMGSVFEAEHTGTGRRVALKLINAGDFSHNEMLIARFHREAKAAGAIDSQHITQVLDTGRDPESGMPYMVMEYLLGEDLQHLLKRLGSIPHDLALRIVAQACLGLRKAHDAHVVHRDIKPANLFLAQRDAGEVTVKLLDFGIAKVKMEHANETESAGLTKTGNMLGSPLYMSPEQARGARTIDHRTDIWSLGVVLYQCLTGTTPYGHITALGQLIISICHDPPPPVQDLAPWVPPEVAAIVHRALRHDPAERFQTADEMFAEVRKLLPNGWTISDAMFVSVTAEAKQQTAPKLSLAASGNHGTSSSQPGTAPAAAATAPDTTASALASSQAGAPAQASRAPLFAGIGAVALLAISGAVYFATRTPAVSATPAPVPNNIPESVIAAASTPAPIPTAAASAPDSSNTAANTSSKLQRVKLVVIPGDVSVEVEGKAASVKDGLVEIEGTLGSVHRVRLFKGPVQSTAEVIVTEIGPSPPKLELKIAGGPGPKTTGAAGAGTASPIVTVPPPLPTGVKEKFE